ncbi:MAG: arylsulfotransferase family protein, partial [Pseudomonadota bacterium]
ELNLVAVVDPETGILRWWRHGPWLKQHDPDFEPDGTITVFDNGTGLWRSRILRIDPADDSISVEFAGTEAQPFYTWRRGKHQVLPNGNVLLTEAEHGRVLEVDDEGGIVWTHDMPWDADHNLIVTEARHVPEGFFRSGIPSCAEMAGPFR